MDQRTCPMCKMDILKYYGLIVSFQTEFRFEWDKKLDPEMIILSLQFTGSQESILHMDMEDLVTSASDGDHHPQMTQVVVTTATGSNRRGGNSTGQESQGHHSRHSRRHHSHHHPHRHQIRNHQCRTTRISSSSSLPSPVSSDPSPRRQMPRRGLVVNLDMSI